MNKPDKERIRRMSRRAYVDQSQGITKVILGDDEWQIVFKVDNSHDALTKIPGGHFSLNDIVPAEVDGNTLEIRKELAQLSAEIVAIYDSAERQDHFYIYDKETRNKTDVLAYEIRLIKQYGLATK